MKVTHFITACWMSALLLLPVSTLAQNNPQKRPHRMHQKMDAKTMTDSMKVRFSLTQDQYPKVLTINQNFTDGMTKLKSTPTGDSISAESQVKTLSENRDAELKKVLTNEQYTAYQEHKQHMMHKKRPRKGA